MFSWNSSDATEQISWLLTQPEPWIRYRTLLDLLDLSADTSEVQTVRAEILVHEKVEWLIAQASAWPGYPLKRHNDANHPIHMLGVLADFGLELIDPGIERVVTNLLAHQSEEGAFQTLVEVPKNFGGSGKPQWIWMLCDAPNILNALQRFGIRDEPAVKKAEAQIAGLVRENGWTCAVSPQLGKFRGPGRKEDPCPYANLIALKALLYAGDDKYSEEVEIGVQMLLDHWENQADRKKFLFGIGTTYRRLKYPFIWYDILHVLDTLSMLPSTIADSRIQEMLQLLLDLQDDQGKFKAGSVWTAWKGWEFAQKREPSPMITLLVMRILKRFARQC